MKTEKDFINWIKKTIEYYRPFINIGLQEINVKKNDTEFLEITYTYPYLEPELRYSDKSFNDWLNGNLPKHRILHELCHILTDPLYGKATSRYVSRDEITDERERLTDTICVILNKLIK